VGGERVKVERGKCEDSGGAGILRSGEVSVGSQYKVGRWRPPIFEA